MPLPCSCTLLGERRIPALFLSRRVDRRGIGFPFQRTDPRNHPAQENATQEVPMLIYYEIYRFHPNELYAECEPLRISPAGIEKVGATGGIIPMILLDKHNLFPGDAFIFNHRTQEVIPVRRRKT